MLILKRRPTEELVLDEQSQLTVISTSPGRVKLSLSVPSNVPIRRLGPVDSLDCEPLLVTGTETVVP